MANKIGIVLAVDGENEFKAAMKNAASAVSATKAELKAVTQEFSNNANSMAALTAKQATLIKQQSNMKAATKAAQEGLENARKAVEKHAAAVAESDKKISAAEQELNRLKTIYGEGSEAVKKQEEALEDLNQEQDENKRNLQTAQTALNQWSKRLNNCTADEKKNSDALKQNEKYMDEAKKSTDKCATSIDQFGKKVKDSGRETESAGKKWADAFRTGLAVHAVDMAKNAVGELGEKAKEAAEFVVDVGSSFEKAMSEVQAISGASGSELEKITEKAKTLGSTTKFSATEAADAFKYMSLAGWDANTSLEAVDGIMNLAAASGMELAEASDMVTDYLSAFGMEASEATKMADMMAYAQAHSNTSAKQLGEAYGNCAAGLNTAGQSIGTVTALLEAMANQGTKGSEAGTALNGIMSQITQKMKDGAIQIGKTSVAVQDEQGNYRDLIDILADVESATDGMGSAEKSAALAAVFNRTSLSGLNQVLNEGVENVRGYRDALSGSAGAASEMAGIMENNLQGDLTTMNSALEGLGIAAYDYVDGPLRGVVQGVTDVINGLTDTLTPQKTLLEQFVEDVQASNDRVQESLDLVSETLNTYEEDATKLDHYKEVLADAAEATDLTKFEQYQISEIVGELAGSIPELSAAWDEEAGVLRITADEVRNLIEAYSEQSKVEAYTKAMKESFDALAQAEVNKAKADSAVKTAMEEVAAAEKAYTDSSQENARLRAEAGLKPGEAYDEEAKALDRARGALEEAEKAQKEANDQQEQAQKDYDLCCDVLDEMGDKYGTLGDKAGAAADEAADGAEEIAGAVAQIDPEKLEELTKAAEDMEKNIAQSMQGAVDAFKTFSGGAEVSLDEVIKNLDSQIEGLSNWTSNMEKLGEQVGSGMTQELYDKLAEMGPEAANLVQELVDSLEAEDGQFEEVAKKWTEAINLSENADVVSKATSAGKELAEAHGEGLEQGSESVNQATKKLTDGAVEQLGQATEEFRGKGKENADGYGDGAGGETEYVSSKFGALAGMGTTQLTDSKEGATDAGSGAARAFGDAAENESDYVSSEFGALAGHGVTQLNSKKSEASSAGSNMASGFASGIRSGKSQAVNAAIELAKAAISAAKREAQIASPSKKWKKEVGEQLSKGMAQGILSAQNDPINAARAVSDAVTDAATAWIEKKKKSLKISAKDEKQYWKEVNGIVAEGVAEYKNQMKTLSAVQSALDAAEDKELSRQVSKKFGVKNYTIKTTGSGNNKKKVKEKKDADTYYGEIFSEAKNYLDNFETIHDVSLEQELKYWQKVQAQLKKGTDAWYDAQKEINSVQTKIKDNAGKIQSETLKAQEAYIKKRQYQGKMDVDTELDYWKEQIKGYKKYSDEWYKITDRIQSLRSQKADQRKAANDKILSDAQDYVRKRQILGKMDEEQELDYWSGILKQVKKGSDAWYDIKEKIAELQKQVMEKVRQEEEAALQAVEDNVNAQKEKVRTLSSVQSSILSKYKVYYKTSAREEAQYWNIARKQFKKGTEERIEADQAWLTAREEYYDQMRDLDEQYKEDTSRINDELKKQVEDLQNAYTEAVKSSKQSILQGFDLFSAWDNEGYTKDALLRNAKTQVEGLKLWEAEITKLRKKNLPAELMDQLEEMGPEATASIYSLNQMTSKELDEWVKLWEKKNEIADRQAETQNKKLLKDTADSVNKATAEAQKELDKVNADYLAALQEIQKPISDELKKLIDGAKKTGEDTVAGLIGALKSEQNQVEVYNAAGAYVTQVEKQFANLPTAGSTAGKSATQAVATGMTSNTTEYTAAVQSLQNTLKNKDSWTKAGADIANNLWKSFSSTFESKLSSWQISLGAVGKQTKKGASSGPSITIDTSGISNVIMQILAEVANIGNQVGSGFGVVLDSGKLVGALAPGIGQALAAETKRSSRGKK